LNGGLHSYLYDEDPNYNHSRDVLINSAFASLFKNNLNSTKLIESLDSNIFDLKYIENIIKEYTENNKVDDENISNLFSLCMHSLILPKC
jgi:hypothetical protein